MGFAWRNVSWKWRFDVYHLTAQCLLCSCNLLYVSELTTPRLSFVSIPCIISSKKAVPDPMSLKWLLFVSIWQRGPLFNSKSLCYSELSRILTCVFQSMMPHLHTLLGRQSPDPVQADSQHGNDPYLHAPEDALVLRAQLSKASESESSHPAVVWSTL